MIRVCAGIDVGLSSAAAATYGYANGSNLPRLISTYRIPTTGEGGGKRIDVRAFGEWLTGCGASIAYIENATAMPAPEDKDGNRRRMGAGTMARYLRACGAIEATVTLAGLDGVMCMPGVWKRALGLTKRTKGMSANQRKNESVVLARELFPERADTTFKVFNSHNVAEAGLIAIYAAVRTDLVRLRAD